MLQGEEKKTYQRNYMREYQRKRRATLKLTTPLFRPKVVRPKMYMAGVEIGVPNIDADGNVIYDE